SPRTMPSAASSKVLHFPPGESISPAFSKGVDGREDHINASRQGKVAFFHPQTLASLVYAHQGRRAGRVNGEGRAMNSKKIGKSACGRTEGVPSNGVQVDQGVVG